MGATYHLNERGDILLSWLLKMVLFFGIAGMVAFDGLSVLVTNVSTMDDAKSAAVAGADILARQPKATKAAFMASENQAELSHASIVANSWYVDDAGTVHLTLKKEADSMLAKHIPPLRSLLTVQITESAAPVR